MLFRNILILFLTLLFTYIPNIDSFAKKKKKINYSKKKKRKKKEEENH